MDMDSQIENKDFFKGKGNIRRVMERHDSLLSDLELVKREMNDLVQVFNETHRMPRVVHLRVLNRTPCPIMYWRMPGVHGKQPFIKLFQCERGRGVLHGLSISKIKEFYVLEEQRLSLNLTASVLGNEIAAILRYINGHSEARKYVVAVS